MRVWWVRIPVCGSWLKDKQLEDFLQHPQRHLDAKNLSNQTWNFSSFSQKQTITLNTDKNLNTGLILWKPSGEKCSEMSRKLQLLHYGYFYKLTLTARRALCHHFSDSIIFLVFVLISIVFLVFCSDWSLSRNPFGPRASCLTPRPGLFLLFASRAWSDSLTQMMLKCLWLIKFLMSNKWSLVKFLTFHVRPDPAEFLIKSRSFLWIFTVQVWTMRHAAGQQAQLPHRLLLVPDSNLINLIQSVDYIPLALAGRAAPPCTRVLAQRIKNIWKSYNQKSNKTWFSLQFKLQRQHSDDWCQERTWTMILFHWVPCVFSLQKQAIAPISGLGHQLHVN